MNGSRRRSKFLFAILIIQVLAICVAFCACLGSGEEMGPQNAGLAADHPDNSSQNAPDNATNNYEGTFSTVTIQGHVIAAYEGCYYKIYIDKVLTGYGLEGLSGFKLVPGATVETTAVNPCPDISMGDCVEVHGYWSTTDSPPIYLGNEGAYINKIPCSTRNHPPMTLARPTGSKSGYIGTSYIYTISATDPDRDPVKFIFDWGDSTTSETGFVSSDKSISVSHIWSDTGIYWVKAKAIDSKGAAASWSKPLIVTIKQKSKPSTPTAPTGPASGSIEASYRFSVSAMSPDRNQVKFIFDWGDSTTSETGFVNSGRIASASHEWSDTGVYWVKSRAIDSTGASSSWSKPLIVTIKQKSKPATPTMPIGPTAGSIGMIYKFAISGLDPNKGTLYSYASSADSNREDMRYIFDWGDGTTSETGYVSLGRLASISHAWGDAGIYWVKARSIDSKGTSSSWSKPLIVTIKQNSRPARTTPEELGPQTTSNELSSSGTGTNYTFTTTAMDPKKIFMLPSIDPQQR